MSMRHRVPAAWSASLLLGLLGACAPAEALAPESAAWLRDASGAADASVAQPVPPDAEASDAGAAPADSGAYAALHVLFIGNSYTYVNDLPGILRGLATSSKVAPTITTEQVTPGGTTLQDKYVGVEARAAIAKKTFTHVVLQGYSTEPLWQPVVFQKYAALFAGEARDAGAVVGFYETWARRVGDGVYQLPWSGGTPAAMQDGLLSAYTTAATASGPGTLLAKVGEGWRASLAAHPTLVLHLPDGTHPTLAGSVLAAYVLYITLAGHDVPPTAAVPAGISAANAADLHAIALSVTH